MKRELIGFRYKNSYYNMTTIKHFGESDCKELVSLYEKDLSPKEKYQIEVNILSEYRTSVEDFTKWLKEESEYDYFLSSLEDLRCHDISVYDIASSYRIPVSMVKYLIQVYKRK